MSAIETATKMAVKTAQEVSKINAVAGLVAAVGTFLLGLGACQVGEIIMKAMDNNEKEKGADTADAIDEKYSIGRICRVCKKRAVFNNVCRNCGAQYTVVND